MQGVGEGATGFTMWKLSFFTSYLKEMVNFALRYDSPTPHNHSDIIINCIFSTEVSEKIPLYKFQKEKRTQSKTS